MVTNIKDKSSKFAREGRRPIEKQFLADKQGTGCRSRKFQLFIPETELFEKERNDGLFLSPNTSGERMINIGRNPKYFNQPLFLNNSKWKINSCYTRICIYLCIRVVSIPFLFPLFEWKVRITMCINWTKFIFSIVWCVTKCWNFKSSFLNVLNGLNKAWVWVITRIRIERLFDGSYMRKM